MSSIIMDITCNICQNVLEDSGYRTSCNHLLCIQCATEAFTSGISCPQCGNVLSKTEVHSLSIGKEKPTNFLTLLFEYTLSTGSWKTVKDDVNKLFDNIKDVINFSNTQLMLDAEKSKATATEIYQEVRAYKAECTRLNEDHSNYAATVERKLIELDERLQLKEKELIDFKAAYKEKMRKCQAWEKAYNSLRNQVADPSKQLRDRDQQDSKVLRTIAVENVSSTFQPKSITNINQILRTDVNHPMTHSYRKETNTTRQSYIPQSFESHTVPRGAITNRLQSYRRPPGTDFPPEVQLGGQEISRTSKTQSDTRRLSPPFFDG